MKRQLKKLQKYWGEIKMKKRIPLIAGNWKMYKTRDEALAFIYAVNEKLPRKEVVETVIAAPFIYLRDLVKREGDNLRIAAQNVHYKDEGAFTGEVAAPWLNNLNVEYVIIGHSERRAYYNETDEDVNLKVKASLKNDITPIICVGESLKVREADKTKSFVTKQIKKAYLDLTIEEAKQTVVAYEPIWAIGTGKTATKEQANETILDIRNVLKRLYGKRVSDKIRILYGGSVNPKNIDELLSMSDIDGALVGGASLDPNSYLELVNAALKQTL